MKNVNMELHEDILVIKIDITKRQGLSSSGKNIIIATTSGNTQVPGFEHISIGVNCYTKP